MGNTLLLIHTHTHKSTYYGSFNMYKKKFDKKIPTHVHFRSVGDEAGKGKLRVGLDQEMGCW